MLLRELIGDNQNTIIKGQTSYVPQSPWLQNLTVKENIRFGSKSQQKFQKVIQLSQLTQDIDTFIQQEKDLNNFQIGPNGAKFSGGQKQRTMIARAIYSSADIILMDDIFSAVDPQVADQIYSDALEQSLSNKIRILAMPDVKFSLEKVTKIILVTNGVVTTDQNAIKKYLGSDQQPLRSKSMVIKEQNNIMADSLLNSQMEIIDTREEDRDDLIEQSNEKFEKREQGAISNKSLLIYIKEMGYLNFFLILLSMSLMQFSLNYYDIWLKDYVSDEPDFMINKNFEETLIFISGISLLLTLFRAFQFAYANLIAAKNIFVLLLQKVLFSVISFFESNDVGNIINRFSEDGKIIDSEIAFQSNILLKNLFTIIGSIIIIAMQSPLMIFAIAIVGYIFYFIQRDYRHSTRQIKRLSSAATSTFLTHVNETSQGIKTIRAFSQEKRFQKEFMNKFNIKICCDLLLTLLGNWLSIRLQFLSVIFTFSVLTIMIIYVFRDTGYNPDSIALSLIYSLNMTQLLRDLIMNITSTEKECISLERVHQYFSNKTEDEIIDSNQDDASFLPIMFNKFTQTQEKQQCPIIEFQNVSHSYDKINQVLKNISFKIYPNQRVAFVGRTGSGKSSILNCLFRFYDSTDGRITVFSRDIQSLKLNELRSLISIIPQSGFIYKSTVQNNIDPQQMHTEAQIEKYLQLFNDQNKNQSIQDYSKTPKIFDFKFQLNNQGENISQGEKQLINLTRCFLKQSDIICLDEATANLDTDYVEKTLKIFKELKNKTLIYITHKLETLKDFDTIYVLDQGKIVQKGTYEELSTNKSGMFYKLQNQNQQDINLEFNINRSSDDEDESIQRCQSQSLQHLVSEDSQDFENPTKNKFISIN